MRLEDVNERIDDYFENVSDEEFIEHLESSGFIIFDDDEDELENETKSER